MRNILILIKISLVFLKKIKYSMALIFVLTLVFACSETKTKDKNFPVGSFWSTYEFANQNDRLLNGGKRNALEFIDKKILRIKINNECFKDRDGELQPSNLAEANKFFYEYEFNYKYVDNFVQIFSGVLITDTKYQDNVGALPNQKRQVCSYLQPDKHQAKNIGDILDLKGEGGFILQKKQKQLELILKNASGGQAFFIRRN